jgi:hypothetical protein
LHALGAGLRAPAFGHRAGGSSASGHDDAADGRKIERKGGQDADEMMAAGDNLWA